MQASTPSYNHLIKILVASDYEDYCDHIVNPKVDFILKFVDESNSFSTTIGATFKIKTINIDDKIVKMQIWEDTSRPLEKPNLSGAKGIMLLYDTTNQKSFTYCRNYLQNITQNDFFNTLVVYLIGDTSLEIKRKKVISTEEGQKIADKYKIKFIECHTGENINVTEAFTAMASNIINNDKLDYFYFYKVKPTILKTVVIDTCMQISDNNYKDGFFDTASIILEYLNIQFNKQSFRGQNKRRTELTELYNKKDEVYSLLTDSKLVAFFQPKVSKAPKVPEEHHSKCIIL